MTDKTMGENPNFNIEMNIPSTKQKQASSSRFATLTSSDLDNIVTERHSKRTKQTTNWGVTTFKNRGEYNMKWIVNLGFFLLVCATLKGAAVEQAQVPRARSRRNLVKNIDIYSLDHFIALVEKVERHSKVEKKPIKVIANYIRKLAYNDTKWSTLIGTMSESMPAGALTSEEKEVLTNMIRHRFVGLREQGVVHTPYGDVAMGRVITGICAGIDRNENILLKQIYQTSSKHIDNLYAATLTGDLGMTSLAHKINSSLPLLGPGGTWSPNTQCPEFYILDRPTHSRATNAQIRGGVDGFLLGSMLSHPKQKEEARLGQLLRMYYNGGVIGKRQYAACRRRSTFNRIVKQNTLTEQITLATYAVKIVWNNGIDFSGVQNSDIPQLSKALTQQFYTNAKGLQSGYKCPENENEAGCLLPANLVFILDESASITAPNYIVEKTFVKNITDAFDIAPYHARVAVVEYSDDATESIKLGEYYSKSTLMCAVDSLEYTGGFTYTSKALTTAYGIFTKAKANAQTGHSNDPQIMILLTDGESVGGEEELKPLVEIIKKDIEGITMIAVGVGNYKKSELELISTDPSQHVLTTNDFNKLISLVKELRKKSCETATVLKPIDFNDGKGSKEDGTKYEVKVTGVVDPGKGRFFTIPSDTLSKTENISIEVKSRYGTVSVYLSRSNKSPGPQTGFDHKLIVDGANIKRRRRRSTVYKSEKGIEFYNICKGYSATTCPPLYVSVYGGNSTNTCSDFDCSVPSQIKFEIRTAQIMPVMKKNTICYFTIPSEKLKDAAEISIKISAPESAIEMYSSRLHAKPDKMTDFTNKLSVGVGKTSLKRINDPCNGYINCPPLYFTFVGSKLSCSCKTDVICANTPRQVTLNVKPKDICLYNLSSDSLKEAKTIDIKITASDTAIEMYSSRMVGKLDLNSNLTKKLSTMAGSTTWVKIQDPCSGYTNCPAVRLTFVGSKLSCNCTTDMNGQRQCDLPRNVTITMTKGHSMKLSAAKEAQLSLLVSAVIAILHIITQL